MKTLIRWNVGAWAVLVLVASAVMVCGLVDSFSFLGRPPSFVEGHRLVLLGALAFAVAAVWAGVMRQPLWVVIPTALPAAVVGGLAVQLPDSGFAHLAGLLLVPLAVTTMLMAIPAETSVKPLRPGAPALAVAPVERSGPAAVAAGPDDFQ